MKRIMVLLVATLGLFLSAPPSFSQTGGYPPGPTTTSTAVPGGGGVLGAPDAPGGAPGAVGGPGGTGGSAVVEPVVLAQAPPPAAAVPASTAGSGARFAVTGANAVRLASIGLVLFMAGVLLVTVTRRRRDRTAYLSG